MGNFKVEIEAVGGHGDFREVKQGDKLPDYPGQEHAGVHPAGSPDCMARAFAAMLSKSNNVLSAKLIHWPDNTPIVDNLLTGIREHGDFMERWQGEEMLRYFAFSHLPEGPMRETSRLFCHLAFMVVRTLARSAERTVALRKLLEGKDAAVRAAMVARP